MTEQQVERAGRTLGCLLAAAGHERDAATNPRGLGRQRRREAVEQGLRRVEADDRVPGPGQRQRLRPLATAHVEDTQPRAVRHELAQLLADQPLADGVPQAPELLDPAVLGTLEPGHDPILPPDG